jgi:tungstate transport system substrate-binding protein
MTERSRREFLRFTAAGTVLGAVPVLSACSKPNVDPTPASTSPPSASPSPPPPPPPADAALVRVASVPTAVEGNLLPELVARFEEESGIKVDLRASQDVYELARGGSVDLAISHYGHKHAEAFVMEGLGEWPRTLFSNQMALLGPKSDPAKVRGLGDVGEAFRLIAQMKAPFVLNDIDGVRYLTEILWHAAGRPDRAGWLMDERQHRKEDAIHVAAKRGAYVFWGLTPFLRFRNDASIDLEPLVLGDPLLQRMLVSIIVKPSKAPGVNVAGAEKLQTFLLSPATQARIRSVRYPGQAHVSWVAGGRHNRTAMLPKT